MNWWVFWLQGGFTPLSVAVQQNHAQVATVLLETEAGSRFQLPALHVAAKKDDAKSISLLLKSKHDPNSTTKVDYVKIKSLIGSVMRDVYIFKSLHSLKVNERIEYKLLSVTYKVLTTTQPSYLHNLISI